jgi:hypothetical protein
MHWAGIKKKSDWEFKTSGTGALGIGFAAAEGGISILPIPKRNRSVSFLALPVLVFMGVLNYQRFQKSIFMASRQVGQLHRLLSPIGVHSIFWTPSEVMS